MESYLSYNRFPKQLSFYGNLKIQMSNRILIVDDSQPMRELIKMMLNGVAEVVGECADGAEALDAYTRLQPDWVLMDIAMKDVDGIAATRQIIDADPKARVLIVTDYNDDVLRQAAREAGACQYIVKEDLLDILEILPKA
jgi:CheY-like chemotaxis protein